MANGDPLKAGFLVDETSSTGLRKTTSGSHVYIIWSDKVMTDVIFCWAKEGIGVTGVGALGVLGKAISAISTGVRGDTVTGIGVCGVSDPGFGISEPKGTGVLGTSWRGAGVAGLLVEPTQAPGDLGLVFGRSPAVRFSIGGDRAVQIAVADPRGRDVSPRGIGRGVLG